MKWKAVTIVLGIAAAPVLGNVVSWSPTESLPETVKRHQRELQELRDELEIVRRALGKGGVQLNQEGEFLVLDEVVNAKHSPVIQLSTSNNGFIEFRRGLRRERAESLALGGLGTSIGTWDVGGFILIYDHRSGQPWFSVGYDQNNERRVDINGRFFLNGQEIR